MIYIYGEGLRFIVKQNDKQTQINMSSPVSDRQDKCWLSKHFKLSEMINTEPGTTGEKELNNLGSNCDVKLSHENQMIL